MSQNENNAYKFLLVLSMLLITGTTFAFNACSGGFQSAQSGSDSSANITSSCPSCSLPSTSSGSFSSMALSLAQLLELAVSNFPGLSTCQAASACTGAGPSSQMCTATGSLLSGTTTLTYNGANCSFETSNQVNIAANLQLTDSAESLQISSAQSTDYLGGSSGGGILASYSIETGSAQISDQGVHISGTGIDISTHSTSPATATVNIGTLEVTVNGGQFILSDNTNLYSAAMTFNNLVFGASCACPISGSASGTLSGSTSGTVSMSFNPTCGSMTVTSGGSTSTITVPGC